MNKLINTPTTATATATTLTLPNKIIKEGSVLNKINFFNECSINKPFNKIININCVNEISTSDDLNNSILKLKEKILNEPNQAINYFNLAVLLNESSEKSVTLLDGKEMNQKELYCKSWNLDQSFIGSLNNLSTLLIDSNETIYLNDKYQSINRFELSKLIYETDSNYSINCHNLAVYLPTNSTLYLSNGNSITNKELYLKSIQLILNENNNNNNIGGNDDNSHGAECCLWKSFYGLYFELDDDESILIQDSNYNNTQQYTKKEILIKILQLIKDSSIINYYNNYNNSKMSMQLSNIYYLLSNYLIDPNDKIQLPNLQEFESNNSNNNNDAPDSNSSPNNNNNNNNNNKFILMEKKDLYLESLKFNPINYNIMLELAELMTNQELILLPFIDGTSKSFSKVDVLFLLINIDISTENNQSIVLKANQLYQNIKW